MFCTAILATLMVGQIQPTCNVLITDSTGDTLVWIVSDDGVEATFSVNVTRTSGGKYHYTYGLQNHPQSSQKIYIFAVQVAGWDTARDTFIVVDSMKGVGSWKGSAEPLTGRYLQGVDPERDSIRVVVQDPLTGDTSTLGWLPPAVWNPRLRHTRGEFNWHAPGDGLLPGSSVDSLQVWSSYPPDPAHFRVHGSEPVETPRIWTGDDSLYDWALGVKDSCEKRYDGRWYPFAGVAPGWPVPAWPAAYGHLEDRLERVDSLGWFLDSTLKRELDSLLTRAYEAYKRRQYLVAFHNLSLALGRLNTGRGSRINDLGYFVLYYRFLEAREKLPGSPEEIRRTSPR